MISKDVRILWFLYGDKTIASSRLQGYLIHEQLQKENIQSYITYAPINGVTPDLPFFFELPYIDIKNSISIIQKLRGKNTDRLINWLKDNGSYVIYVNCDIEPHNQSWKLANMILATSKTLCNYHQSQSFNNVKIIFEPYEYCITTTDRKTYTPTQSNILRVSWFGNKNNWKSITKWKGIIENEFKYIIKLTTCSDHMDADIKWSFENQKKLLSETDICLLPINNDFFSSAKSANRAIQAMAMGIVCITGPLDAYIRIKKTGAPIIIAYTDDDFRNVITHFLDTEKLKSIKKKSIKFVKKRFSTKITTLHWLDIFSSIKPKQITTKQPIQATHFFFIYRHVCYLYKIITSTIKLIKNSCQQTIKSSFFFKYLGYDQERTASIRKSENKP
jgi:hypothetical protein